MAVWQMLRGHGEYAHLICMFRATHRGSKGPCRQRAETVVAGQDNGGGPVLFEGAGASRAARDGQVDLGGGVVRPTTRNDGEDLEQV